MRQSVELKCKISFLSGVIRETVNRWWVRQRRNLRACTNGVQLPPIVFITVPYATAPERLENASCHLCAHESCSGIAKSTDVLEPVFPLFPSIGCGCAGNQRFCNFSMVVDSDAYLWMQAINDR